MKNTNKRILALLLTLLLLLVTVAFGFSAAAKDADYNWQSIPTSPEGLAEGEWYMDFTDFQGALNLLLSMAAPGAEDDWYLDEDAMVLKAEGVIPQGMHYQENGIWKEYPETMVKMELGDSMPGCMEYFVYRFLNRVGQSWSWLSSEDPYYSVRGYRIDYPALARQVIAADSRWSDADYDTVLALVRDGEWIADLDHGLLKGCYGVSTELTAFGRDQYRFVLPSEAFFAACVTDEPIPAPEITDLSALSGQWSDTISWTLEDGTLTISGTGALEEQIITIHKGPIYSRLYYNWEELSFHTSGNGYGRSTSLLQDEINNAVCAHFGMVNPYDDSLEQEILHGRLDPIEVVEYYNDLLRQVKTVVIEEGITSVDKYVLSSISPQKLVLPASMTDGNIELNLPFFFSAFSDMDLYIANPEADFTSLQISIPAFSEAFLSLSPDEISRCYIKLMTKQFELMAAYDLNDLILKELFEVRNGINASPPRYPSLMKTEEQILADWNARTGNHYTSADDLIADSIAAINALLGTDFTTLDELFYASQYSSSAYSTQAFLDAENAFWDREAQNLIADDPSMEVYFNEGYVGERFTFSFGQAIPASEDGTVYHVPDWFTIHGYEGSTTEAAAAASGVRFAPLCPVDYTHTVTEKEIAPSCTEVGHSKGWYCEDCDAWLTGEAIDPTDHTPGSPVREDLIPPTCIVHGGYDDVIYCMQCGCEINRTHEVIDAVGHAWGEWTVVKAPTTNEEGMEQRVCTNDTSHVETRTLAKLPQSDNGGNNNTDDDGGFFGWIQRAMKGLVDWFKKLLSFLRK